MLHKADPIVKLHIDELRALFEGEVLQYLLIDGDVEGAVMGHVRIGPHGVDDIHLLLPASEQQARRDEILGIVSQQYHAPRNGILKYCGNQL